MQSTTLVILIRIYLQTFGLAVLFVFMGMLLVDKLLPHSKERPHSLSFICGSGFFLGMSLFLILFVFLSRLIGSAQLGLWLTLGGTAVVTLREFISSRRRRYSSSQWLVLASSLLGLVLLFSVTNLTLWLQFDPAGPSPPPRILEDFGSIHSGRYANYAILVADDDRIPRVPQNLGQSLLASFHLLLGASAPLAALMVWIPFSLTALACVVFGLFRNYGLTIGTSLGGTFFVLYCNIALSLVAVLVLDNGSPLGFAGYTDVIIAAGTYPIFAVWLSTILLDREACSNWLVGLPILLGLLWCWTAPQNVIVGAGAAVGTYLLWVLWHPAERWVPLRRLAMSAAALLISVALGATHFGVFLPRSMQENVKVPVLSPGSHVRLRPYFLYVVTHWTDPRWNRMAYINPPSDKYTDVYLSDSSDAEPLGRAAVVTRWVCLFEMDFWASLRLYGFLPLGLMLMGQTLYSRCPIGTWSDYKSLLVWFWVALFSFSIGYAIAFLFELGYMKWWLSRFLVPGVVVCLVGLVLALARPAGEPWPRMRRAAWTLCIVIGTFGPAVEFCQTFYNNWIGSAKTDPFAHRLNLLVEATGPFN